MNSENNPTSTEIPADQIPAENPLPAGPPEIPNVPAAPPAADLVVHGEIDEQQFADLQAQLEDQRRRNRELETQVSERERDLQNLRQVQTSPPAAPKEKRKRSLGTIIGHTNRKDE